MVDPSFCMVAKKTFTNRKPETVVNVHPVCVMYTFNASVTGVTQKTRGGLTMANAPVPASGAAPRPGKPIHPKGLYKAFAASLTGTALEWYDFAVYSAAAAVVFPIVFSPRQIP
jgi:hypothetical protein